MLLAFEYSDLTQKDKTGFSLFGSALVHIVVILGIGFSYQIGTTPDNESPSISTTLANMRNTEDIEDSKIFAEVSQAGGGLGEEEMPVRSPLPLINDPITQAEKIARNREKASQSGLESTFLYIDLPNEILLSLNSKSKIDALQKDAPEQEGQEALIRSPLVGQLDSQLSTGAKNPRQKFISSRTREHKYASYMEAWRSRIEQVGNANYPEEVKTKRLSGNLVLNVAIRSDGSVQDIEVIRSSGQKILDDAATRIVMMAAPYNAFPEELLKEVDVIHITRTWQFLHNGTLIQN